MYANILHATDLSDLHMALCARAIEIAKQFHSKLYLLHVIEAPASLQVAQSLGFAEFSRPNPAAAEAVMKTLGEAFNIPIKQQYVEVGNIKTHVANKIKSLKCNLVILGSHIPNYLPTFLDNSAVHMAGNMPCDVLILHRMKGSLKTATAFEKR